MRNQGRNPAKKAAQKLFGFRAAFWSQILKILNWKMKNKLQSSIWAFCSSWGQLEKFSKSTRYEIGGIPSKIFLVLNNISIYRKILLKV